MLLVMRDAVKYSGGQYDSVQLSHQSETGGKDRPIEAQRNLEVPLLEEPSAAVDRVPTPPLHHRI
jgi:hypothetical protein